MRNGKTNQRARRTMILLGIALFLTLGVGLVPNLSSVFAQDSEISGTVWVANEYGNSISVIDTSTNEVITTLTGIEGPHNLQVAPDGRIVWAVSGEDSIAIKIDATSYALMGTVPTGEHPAHVILTPDGSTVYVTNGGDNTVTAIDAETMAVVATIPVGESPHGARPSPDGQWIYVANANGTTLSVIETAANNRVADIEVGERPVQVAFSPDGAFVYVSLNGDNALGKVEVATRTLVSTVDVGVGPIQVFVTPDNRYVLVANQGTESDPGTTVSLVDTETFTVVNTLETGQGAHGVVVEPAGTYAYITNIYADNVAVLDLTTQEVIASIPVGSGPNGISFSSVPAVVPSAQEIALEIAQASGEGGDHNAHHPSAEVTPTPTPVSAGTGTMDEMDAGGMDMMTMMQNMSAMMDSMMNMEMSDDMRAEMEAMRGMMDMMMSDDMMLGMDMMSPTVTPDVMAGMDMGGGHVMEPISSEGVPAATENLGGQPLDYRLEDGVKVFDLRAEPVLWNILDGVTVTAWTYNSTVPGPMIRVTEGDRVRINFTNNLPEPTTIHWHGLNVPNGMDGVPGVTQEAVQPGETFTYEFEARPVGTFMYHSHFDSDVQVSVGLYAPFIIDPTQPETPAPDVDVTLMFSEWRVVDGLTYPAMPMAGSEPNYFTINGHAFPATETITVQRGQRVRLRLIGIGQFVHPMHLHGMPFKVVAIDGYPVPEGARQMRDTLSVAPGERYDIEFVATELGTWMFHCHILHHVTNDGVEPGGLALVINVVE